MTSGHELSGNLAQSHPTLVALTAAMQPPVRSWANAEAAKIKAMNADAQAAARLIRADARTRFPGQLNFEPSIDALVTVVMALCAQDAADELKSQLTAMQSERGKKEARRDISTSIKSDLDSLSDASKEQELRMQMLMARKAKADEALSNLLKKISDTASQIISNLK